MKLLPEPEYFETPGDYGRNGRLCVTPYCDNQWTKAVLEFGVKVPEVIDMTMGKSKCNQCKAVYAGYQPKCEAKIISHMVPGSYYKTRGYNSHYVNTLEPCGGHLEWELHKNFEIQKEFFGLLSKIGSLPNPEYDPLHKFVAHFPPGVTEQLRVRLLAKEIEEQMTQVRGALHQIAGKMHNAGISLQF